MLRPGPASACGGLDRLHTWSTPKFCDSKCLRSTRPHSRIKTPFPLECTCCVGGSETRENTEGQWGGAEERDKPDGVLIKEMSIEKRPGEVRDPCRHLGGRAFG